MSLGNLGLETLVVMLAGFLIGVIPAFVFIGFYFGRRLEKKRERCSSLMNASSTLCAKPYAG